MKSGKYTITPCADPTQSSATTSPANLEINEGEKIPYPRGLPILLISMFLERIAINGTKTILIMYLSTQLAYSTDGATLIYHSFMTLVFFTAICGAVISDSWLGKYNTVLLMFATANVGMLLLCMGTVPGLQPIIRELTISGLIITSLGVGSMRPCIQAFGGDQYKLPEQEHLMTVYFAWVFFAMKVSTFLGTALMPTLRSEVKCFGQEDCYTLAYGVALVLVVIAGVCVVAGKRLYVIRPLSGNILTKVIKCIFNAIVTRFKSHKSTKDSAIRTHWLDYAIPGYGKELVQDTKMLLNVLVIYAPIPFYWALNEQTGSRWTLQASRMNGNLFGYYTIEPEQSQIALQIMLIIFIPLFQTVVYPALSRVGVRGDLHKMGLSMVLAAGAFIVAGLVESHVAADYAVEPTPLHSQFRVYNTWPQSLQIDVAGRDYIVPRLDALQTIITATDEQFGQLKLADNHSIALRVPAARAMSYYFDGRNINSFEDSPRKAISQVPILRILYTPSVHHNKSADFALYDQHKQYVRYTRNSENIEQFELAASRYSLHLDGQLVTDTLQLDRGSVSTLLVVPSESVDHPRTFDVNLIQLTPSNSVHMVWMLPQYVFLAAAETIMAVTGMAFAYTESPESMKTVLQACWMLTIALGHFIDVIVVGVSIVKSQMIEYFMFAGILFVNILVYVWLALRYESMSNTLDAVTHSNQ